MLTIKCEESTAEPHELSWAPTELERGWESADKLIAGNSNNWNRISLYILRSKNSDLRFKEIFKTYLGLKSYCCILNLV